MTDQKSFPILILPPEIRIRIWRYTLVKDGDVLIHPYGRQYMMKKIVPSRLRSGKELQWHREDDDRWINSTSLALIHTSRQLYLETALIYYSENTFAFENNWYPFQVHNMLRAFTAAIGPQNASSITAARFYTINVSFIQHLSALPGLKRLTYNPAALFNHWACYEESWHLQIKAYAQSHPSVVIRRFKLRK